MKRVIELTDNASRKLRVEATQNSTVMKAVIGRLCVNLNPAAQEELWRFLNLNKSPVDPAAPRDPDAA